MQPVAVTENSIHQAIRMTAEDALSVRPVMASLIRPFVNLFLQKASCITQLDADTWIKDMKGAHERLLSGVPILMTLSLEPWRKPLEAACEWMLPAIRDAFPAIEADIETVSAAYRGGNLPLSDLSEEYLNGSFTHYESSARSIGVSADTLAFVMNTVLSTVLEAFAPRIWAGMEDVRWSKGNCPICGSLPSVSYLAKPSGDAGEFLKDSGGKKFLHCALCGHNWRINRHICPVCDTTDAELRFFLSVPDYPGERVDICRNCGFYLPCADLRERSAMPHLDMAAVCMVHLDILARQQGFKPLSYLPWNRIEDGIEPPQDISS
jgi:FdhE protein